MALYLKYWLTVVVLHAIAKGKLAVFLLCLAAMISESLALFSRPFGSEGKRGRNLLFLTSGEVRELGIGYPINSILCSSLVHSMILVWYWEISHESLEELARARYECFPTMFLCENVMSGHQNWPLTPGNLLIVGQRWYISKGLELLSLTVIIHNV